MAEESANTSDDPKSEYVDPKSLPPILETNPQYEFKFLENFVRRLICQLTDMQERKRAANWFKFLKKNESEPMAVNYLLILMLAISRKKLVRPFDVQPPSSFEPLGKLKLRGMCRYMLEQYSNLPKKVQKKFPMGISYSDDFKQYGCAQDIGGKGMQCYCAFSNEPVTVWDNSEHLKQYNLQQTANYLAYKMSLMEDKILENTKKSSVSVDGVPENFVHYITSMKKFRMPFIGRLHVKGVVNRLPKPTC